MILYAFSLFLLLGFSNGTYGILTELNVLITFDVFRYLISSRSSLLMLPVNTLAVRVGR